MHVLIFTLSAQADLGLGDDGVQTLLDTIMSVLAIRMPEQWPGMPVPEMYFRSDPAIGIASEQLPDLYIEVEAEKFDGWVRTGRLEKAQVVRTALKTALADQLPGRTLGLGIKFVDSVYVMGD